MAAKSRAEIASDIISEFPTNGNQEITAERLSDFETTVKDSNFNLIDDDAYDVSFSNADFASSNVGDALVEAKAGQVEILWMGTINPNHSLPIFNQKYKSSRVSSITLTSVGDSSSPKTRIVINGTGIDYSKITISSFNEIYTNSTSPLLSSNYAMGDSYIDLQNFSRNSTGALSTIIVRDVELTIYQVP